jgi:hypothetical protein
VLAICVEPLCEDPSLNRGRRPYHAQKEQAGTWEISRLAGRVMCRAGPHGEGDEPKPMINEREKSNPTVVAAKSANEAVRSAEEQMEPRARGRGKCEAAKHAPNTGSGRRVTDAGLHTEGRKRKEEGEDHRSHRPWKSLQDFRTPMAQRLRLGVQSYTTKKLGDS